MKHFKGLQLKLGYMILSLGCPTSSYKCVQVNTYASTYFTLEIRSDQIISLKY